MSEPPYKQVEVEDFCNAERKAIFTLETPQDLLVRVEVVGGLSVRMEPSALKVVAAVMEEQSEQ